MSAQIGADACTGKTQTPCHFRPARSGRGRLRSALGHFQKEISGIAPGCGGATAWREPLQIIHTCGFGATWTLNYDLTSFLLDESLHAPLSTALSIAVGSPGHTVDINRSAKVSQARSIADSGAQKHENLKRDLITYELTTRRRILATRYELGL